MGKLWFSGSAVAVSGQSVVSFKPPVYLQRVSVVRWGQCYKYTAQTVCGLLLLVHQPAVEESEVIIYKALKWNWGLKPMKNVHCSCCLTLMHLFWSVMFFSPVLLLLVNRSASDSFIHIMHCAVGFWKTARENICNHWKHFSAGSVCWHIPPKLDTNLLVLS